ncbi:MULTISPECIES: glycosyltransferase family 4 protein [Dermabacter]|uniref:glycosyltransferase family 4 protein n=1 Tax=Dermabacter TaxID=36739 RepID=UPI0003540B85|nr:MULTISPECIES: glycosyltransferase family 1 protein [Dermabacter]EPH15751.1 hypothetical protein HMPREF1484_01388 [Dermabacter sp. HFH0086]MCT2024448.1 glycosyltransferase family 1 protein [Dermabacter hominis]MDK8803475.1 glycosyltransferase family 1 protein [Dermabacter hominis]MDU0937286.1 glycosyltransferase family 1 protein [Dermabacter sp.]
MKILVVAESFLPHMNGVTNSVLRVVECFALSGHEVRIVAPGAPGIPNELTFGAERVPIIPVLSIPMMGYGQVRMSATTNYRIRSIIDDFHPDVVHLACPALLGNAASKAAVKRGIPTVAIYQTDLPGYTRKYGAPVLEEAMWMFLRDIHNRCEVNLAPSSSTRNQIVEHGIERVQIWRRGVDTSQFSPSRRSDELRERLAPNGEKLVVYVGRLAAEKQVEDLAVLESLPNVRLVIVGEGPLEAELRAAMPGAYFAGFKKGAELAEIVATCDLFVHTGELETFCQTIQEAMASGLPAIAPRSGGPIDLIDHSRTGWLYTPGKLDELRAYVEDLLGDDAKREHFAAAAQDSVRQRTWPVLAEQLLGFYREAARVHEASAQAA